MIPSIDFVKVKNTFFFPVAHHTLKRTCLPWQSLVQICIQFENLSISFFSCDHFICSSNASFSASRFQIKKSNLNLGCEIPSHILNCCLKTRNFLNDTEIIM